MARLVRKGSICSVIAKKERKFFGKENTRQSALHSLWLGTMSRGEMKYTCDWKQTIELFIRFCHCLLPFVIMVVNGKLRYTRRSMKQPSSYRNVVWVP